MPTKKQIQLKWLRARNHNGAMPCLATDGSAGFDIPMPTEHHFSASQVKEIPLGWCVEIPKGYMGFLRLRSGVSTKDSKLIMQSTGIIDSDYRGELVAHITQFRRAMPYQSQCGDCLVQLIILPIPELESVEVKELSDTKRGAGGHGSTRS